MDKKPESGYAEPFYVKRKTGGEDSMPNSLNQNRTGSRCGRLLLCLLLAVLCLSQCIITGSSAAGDEVFNSSGNQNKKLSIDPIKKTEGFSAVLYNNRNGLPTSEANTIAQTSDGFIWIGSYAGLIRFDGNNFERISSTDGIANVRCLYVDSRDRLWIGTNDSGVFLMEKGSQQKWDKADGLRSVSIRAICEDENGLVYVGCAAGGVARVDAKMKLTLLEDERIAGQTIWELRRGADGLIYGLSQEGDLFTLKNGAVDTFLSQDECRIKGIHSILPDPARPDRLYVGTDNSEVYYGNLQTNFGTLGKKDISPLYMATTMESINGQIWICAENGIGRLDSEGFHTLKNVPMVSAIEHVMTDYEGNLWFVSSRQGIMKIVPNQFSNLSERYSLPVTVVNTTCLYGRQLFIGTDTGLIVIDGDRRAESVPLTKAVTASGAELDAKDLMELLEGVRLRSIVQDREGRLWISAWRKYLLCYDQGEVTTYTQEDGLFSNAVRTISVCEDGSILVSGTGGVSVIQNDRVTACYGREDGLVNEDILTVTEGFRHELVLGSDGDGIYVINDGKIMRIGTEDGLKSEIILRVRKSRTQNCYWVVTGNSLAFMTPDFKVTTLKEFPYPNNYDVYETSSGDLWVLSSAGIYVVSAAELIAGYPIDPVFYGMQSGLPYAPTVNAHSELTAEGELYIAGTEGVVKVNIEKPFQDLSDMKIALPFIEADGRRYYADESGGFTLPGGANKITIYPYVFNYSLIDPQVSYRLDGFDPEDETVIRSKLQPVDYTNLKIGAYRFVMTVKDPTGRSIHTMSFPIIKGRELSGGTVGTLIMITSSLVLMGGLLLYTSLYRKRGQLEDRLFFYLILSNVALAIGEALSYLLELSTLPLVKEIMYFGNTVYYAGLAGFPYLFLIYIDCVTNPGGRASLRIRKLIYLIPCALLFLGLIINLWTGWLFSIDEVNTFHPGPHRYGFIPALPLWLYFAFSLIKVLRVNKGLAALGAVLLATRLGLGYVFPGISSTAFLYALILMCIHLYMMERPLSEEAS